MDQAKRERIREIIRFLESAQSEVHEIWLDEEAAFGSAPSDSLRGELRRGRQHSEGILIRRIQTTSFEREPTTQ
jgi:hypothetical protein